MQYADPGGRVLDGTCLCKLYRYVPSKVSLVFELSGYERRSWILASSRKLGMALKRLMKIYICAFSPSIEKASKKREQKCRVFDTIERDLPPKLHKGKVRPSLKT